jgi:[NiFe] hydrogenase diaphorase moiety small subunit
MAKPVIATTSLAGCFGCHMSILDIDERILDLFELVEFNKSPIDDIKTFTKECDIGIIEGGCCNSENIETLKLFRQNCKTLVSLGECAIMGGLPALRNDISIKECLEKVAESIGWREPRTARVGRGLACNWWVGASSTRPTLRTHRRWL